MFALVRGVATRKMCDAYEWQRHADDVDDDVSDNGGGPIALIFSTLYSKIAFQGSTWNPVGSLGVPRGSLGFLRGVNDSWWFLVGFL